MNILVTGGFGDIGRGVVEEGLSRGHSVSVFEARNERTERLARKYARLGVEVRFGDLRKRDQVAGAAAGRDAVIHLAAILPPASDAHPDLCEAVNVGGTANLIAAMRAEAPKAVLVEVSSASVMGPTQRRSPPVRPDDPLAPTDAYSRSKIRAESLVAASGLRHCVLRLAAVMPTELFLPSLLKMVRLIYDMPLEARCEIVLDVDASFALVSAAENLAASGAMSGMTGFIAGGGDHGCQMRIRDMLEGMFMPMGLKIPAESLFSPDIDSYYLDWYDTREIQTILGYQRHGFAQWKELIQRNIGPLRTLVLLFRPFIDLWLARLSPRRAAPRPSAA
jgi:nucleoside-diphosphate-sugar epimerase